MTAKSSNKKRMENNVSDKHNIMENIKSYIKEQEFPIITYLLKIGFSMFSLDFAIFNFKPKFLLFPSMTCFVVVIGVFSITIVIEYIRLKDIWSSFDKDMLLEYRKEIITALGLISGSFFIMLTILWSMDVPLPKLRNHTFIGFAFLIFIFINGLDLLIMLQKKINLLKSQNAIKLSELEDRIKLLESKK